MVGFSKNTFVIKQFPSIRSEIGEIRVNAFFHGPHEHCLFIHILLCVIAIFFLTVKHALYLSITVRRTCAIAPGNIGLHCKRISVKAKYSCSLGVVKLMQILSEPSGGGGVHLAAFANSMTDKACSFISKACRVERMPRYKRQNQCYNLATK